MHILIFRISEFFCHCDLDMSLKSNHLVMTVSKIEVAIPSAFCSQTERQTDIETDRQTDRQTEVKT